MQPLLNIAIGAARLAGDIIIRHMEQLDILKITVKNQTEYFSEVDIKAEQAIINSIRKAYPNHGIIAEESGVFQDNEDSIWIIDPLDGTTSYLHGFPYFSVSIAHQVKNRLEHAIVYDPLRHEYFTASRGRGAQLNDRRIRVSKKTELSSALIGTGFPFKNRAVKKEYLPSFVALSEKCAGLRRTGSAALDLAYVASGRLDGIWELGLRSWDIAAGALLIQESGGLISDPQGRENYMEKGDVIAGNPKIFKALLQTISAAKIPPV